MNDQFLYNFCTSNCSTAVKACKILEKKKEKYGIIDLYNKERIVFISFVDMVTENTLKNINKVLIGDK